MTRVEVFRLLGLELVAAGADAAGGRGDAQQRDLLRRLRREVEQLFLQHALDAVPAGVDRAEDVPAGPRPGSVSDDPPVADDEVACMQHGDGPAQDWATTTLLRVYSSSLPYA